MKRINNYLLNLAAIAALVIPVSCEREMDAPAEEGAGVRTFTCVFAEPDSKVSVESSGKTRWEAGDQILINAGAKGTDRATVTLTAGDISNDGKTATIAIPADLAPYDRKADRGILSTYYAMYPASAVASGNLYYNQAFSETNDLLMAACNVDDTFVFYNLCGVISFKVSGGFDSYIFSGNNGETVAYEVYQARVRDNGKGPEVTYLQSADSYKEFTALDQVEGKVKADGSTVNYVCLPTGANFTGGFTFKFVKNGEIVKVAASSSPVNVDHGKLLNLGDITSHLETYVAPGIDPSAAQDLGAGGTANCYIVSKAGTYKFKTVKGNSTTSVGSVASVEVLWETTSGMFENLTFASNYVLLKTASTLKPGNALIAAKDASGKVLWSWHIWVPKTEVSAEMYGLSWYLMLSRNLGALEDASASAGPDSYGMLYQWGRKDPFPCATPATKKAGTMTLTESIQNPTTFAYNDGTWMTTVDKSVWGDKATKTIYDPCPPGYKVPMREDVTAFFQTDAVSGVTGWQYASGHAFAVGEPQVWFPYTGYIDKTGAYVSAGSVTKVWNSHMDTANNQGYGLFVTNDSSSRSSQRAAQGGTVRCISEQQGSFVNDPGMPVMGSYKRIVFDTSKVVELSGLHLSKDKTFLWGVGDEGYLYKFTNIDGDVSAITPATQWTHDADMEGVTLDPDTGNLYLAIEPRKVYKIPAPNYNSYSTIIEVEEAASMGNSGMEGIAWHKGDLYLGAQSGATLWCYTLSGTKKWKKQLGSIAPGITEVGDLFYDAKTDLLWVSDSEAFKLFVFDGDVTKVKAIYDISFIGNPESVCVDHERGCVWMADDGSTSKIYKITFTGL